MQKYFKCEVKHLATNEDSGEEELKTVFFIVKAWNYTDAESIITARMEQLNLKQFSVSNIAKIKLHGFVNMEISEETETILPCFAVKAHFFSMNGTREVKISEVILVRASDIINAAKSVQTFYRENTAVNATLDAVAEFKVEDVFLEDSKEIAIRESVKELKKMGVELSLT